MDQQDHLTVGSVRVVNNNDFTIKDMFDGVPFTFDPGKAVTIPTDAAGHIFGWSQDATAEQMLVYCQKRHGWNTPDVVRAGNHTKWFNALELKAVRFRLVEVNDEDEEALPNIMDGAPRKSKKGE